MKKIFLLIVAILVIACNKPVDNPVRMVSIPYQLTSATLTKVSYEGDTYSLKETDKLSVKGIDRDDISAILSYDGVGSWSGDLYYNEYEGEPTVGEDLSVLLIHGDNSVTSTYSNKIVYEKPNDYSGSLLQYAIENYSKFTANIDFGDTSVTLHQTSCFIISSVIINVVDVGHLPEGETSIEVAPNNSIAINGFAKLVETSNTQYSVNFIIVMPGNTAISSENSVIKVCDRSVSMINSGVTTLLPNKTYTLNRTIQFKPELGDPYWSDGTYGRVTHPSGVDVVGIIVYVNTDDSDIAKALTEYGNGGGHALVMALYNSDTGIKWGKRGTVYTSLVRSPAITLDVEKISGYDNSVTIGNNSNAVVSATGYRSGLDNHSGDTGWFLPSIGQWMYAISARGFGGADPAEQWITTVSDKPWLTNGSLGNLVLVKEGETDENILVVLLNNRLETLKQHLGCDYDSFGMWIGNDYSDSYWTSSEYDSEKAIRMNLGSVERKNNKYYSSIKIAALDRGSTWAWKEGFVMKVRPFLAF